MNSRLPSELQSRQFLESGNSFGGNCRDWHDLKISLLKFEISNLLMNSSYNFHKMVDLVHGVVERKRWTYGGFHTESSQ